MLRAVREVAEQRQDFELMVVGTGVDYAADVAYADSLNFPENILHFTGEQTPYEVAQWMQESDCFVLFSRYETYAVVLAEAITKGLPFISTATAGIATDLPKECGITIENEGLVLFLSGVKYPFSHHSAYILSSNSEGEYVFGNSL